MREGPDRRKHEKPEQEKTRGGMTRRAFLGGMKNLAMNAAIAGVTMETLMRLDEFSEWSRERTRSKRYEKWRDAPAAERERLIREEVTHAGDFIRSPEGQRILESGTDEEIFTLLQAMPALLRDHVADTSYDIKPGSWPSVSVKFSEQEKVPMALGLQYGREALERFAGGNGVFVAPDTLLTNWHVLGPYNHSAHAPSGGQIFDELPKRLYSAFESAGLDALYVKFPKDYTFRNETERPNVRALSPELTDRDVTGNLVTVAGIDPDESASVDGTKLYPSIAIPVTKRLGIFLERYAFGYTGRTLMTAEQSFMYIAPPGESIFRRAPSRTGSRVRDWLQDGLGRPGSIGTRLHGTSGSPVMMGDRLVGLNCLVGEIQYRGAGIDVGFFHGPDALRRAQNIGMVCSEKDIAAIDAMKRGRDGYSYYDSYEEYEVHDDLSYPDGSEDLAK